MGMFAALVIGYVIGARAGSGNLDEVRDALAALRESEELADLAAAVRAHAGHTLPRARLDGRQQQHRRGLDRHRQRRSGRRGQAPVRPTGAGALVRSIGHVLADPA